MVLGMTKNKKWIRGDMWVWTVYIALCLISLLEVYSASSNLTYGGGHFWVPLRNHFLLMCGGFLLAWGIHILNFGYTKLFLLLLYPVTLALLIVVLVTGHSVNGAARFLELSKEGVTFQPSELAKLALLGISALILSVGYNKETKQTSRNSFLLHIGFTILTCSLIFSEDLSTTVIIAVVMLALAWIASPPKKLFYILLVIIALIGLTSYETLKHLPEDTFADTQVSAFHRLGTWIHRLHEDDSVPADPNDYDINKEMQKTHARIAIATCGIKGRGFGQSVERDFLPQAYSDFIYAIIIEEGGLMMGIIVLALYLTLLYRCIVIARRCLNRYPAYLVMGIALMLVTQAMVHMAVAVGALPITGQTLPLMSKGGTSIIVCSMCIGIILKVSYGVKRIKPKQEEPAGMAGAEPVIANVSGSDAQSLEKSSAVVSEIISESGDETLQYEEPDIAMTEAVPLDEETPEAEEPEEAPAEEAEDDAEEPYAESAEEETDNTEEEA